MRKYILISALIVSGCIPYETIENVNKLKLDLNEFHEKFTKKTGELATVVDAIQGDMLQKAKDDNNETEIVSNAKRKGKTEDLIKDFEVLSNEKLEKTPVSTGGLLGLINGLLDGIMDSPILSMLITLMGGGGMLSTVTAIRGNKKNKRLKMKARKYAKSTELNDVDEDEDLL
jgi:hypothetical protein